MDSEVDVGLESEALRLYFNEVTEIQPVEFEEEQELNEVEQATDFLFKAGLSDLSKIHHEGKEISDCIVNNSIRQRHLTVKQAETIKSRIRTLNKTVRTHQLRRKQRQDIRDVAWKNETSSIGSRSRSATPDSLDSIEGLNNGDLTSDDDQQLSFPNYVDSGNIVPKGKLKWTSSEPVQNKVFSKLDKGDVAYLGSENVILKGYQPLNESSTRIQRERSGSDPEEVIFSQSSALYGHKPSSCIMNQFSQDHNSLMLLNSNVQKENLKFEGVSFEKLIRKQDIAQPQAQQDAIQRNDKVISIDDLSDGEYQYLKPLLWVEVISIFDQYSICVLKRKPSSKRRRGNVFGVNLSTLVMRDMPTVSDNSMVPRIYQCIINELNTRCLYEDGILRVAGQKQKLEFLCNEIEAKFYSTHEQVEKMLHHTAVHDLTGVLKKLLRELPDPLLTMELMDMFYKCSSIPSAEEQVRAINLLVLMLPVEHRNTFRLLIRLFLNIIENEKKNRMSLHNVAMITAPSFFLPGLLLPRCSMKSLAKEELRKQVNGAAICCQIMELILRCGEKLWMLPVELAQQARIAQKKAQDRKDLRKEKNKRIQSGKKKLQRSSTQYEPGDMVFPKIQREFFI